jgi:AcrR family transcriptional regulator
VSISRRKQRTPTPLNTEAIVTAAARLIDSEGLDVVSMRRIADDMNISPMALYRHVATKRELLDSVADRYLSEFDLPDTSGLPWREAITTAMSSAYRAFLAHRSLEQIFAQQHIDAVTIFKVSEAVLQALERAGLGEVDAIRALDALHCYGMGFTQRKAEFRRGGASAATRLRKIEQLPKAEFGAVTRLAGQLATMDLALEFEGGLEFVLDGIELRSQKASADSLHAD